MICIRNKGKHAALVLGSRLYPGETRCVPQKAAALLLERNPDLQLCNPPRPQVELSAEPQTDPQPRPVTEPEPEDAAETQAGAPKARRKK
jgi:hypothetical protein